MDNKKDYGLFKVIGITFLIFVVLTWIIPAGSYSGGEFVKGEVSPVGLYGIFTTLVYSFAVFAQYFVLLLCVGGFYGVLNKTGVYQKIIKGIVNKFASKNNLFLIVSILVFSLITSLFGEVIMVFVLLPFFITVLSKLGYDKLSSLASTVGASLVGMIASISGNLAIYKNYFQIEVKSSIIFNLVMYILLVFLLITYVIAKNKKKIGKKEESENSEVKVLLYKEVKNNKKSTIPMIIILSFCIILLILGLYNWYYSFDLNIFNDLYDKIMSVELFGINIFSKIFGTFSAIGSFNNYDLCAILIVVSVLIGWIYSIKFNDFIESFKAGVKEMLVPAIYVILASMIFSNIVTSNSGNISLTISDFILNLTKDFNIVTGSITGMIGSLFYNDYLYLVNGLYSVLSLYNIEMLPIILFIFQSMFGIMMFILPVSIFMIFGFKFNDVSYKDWLKYIWKFLIQVFAICIIGSIIFSMIV